MTNQTVPPLTPRVTDAELPPAVKPGVFTSEFWLTVGAGILGAFQDAHATGPITAGTVGIRLMPLVAYIFGRSWVKRGQ